MKNTSPKYDIFINHGNVNGYEFYAAKNPDQYDQSVFKDYGDTLLIKQNGDDTYNV